MKRRTAREKALQALYEMDINQSSAEEAMDFILEGQAIDPYLEFLVKGVKEQRQTLDSTIEKYLQKWKLNRLSVVDRNLLRLATFELLHSELVPTNVVINEAIEIAKRFGDEQSSKFVNGVLSNIGHTDRK